MPKDYVNVRVDKHMWDGLGHLIVGLEALPQYQGMRLSKSQVVGMAISRGLLDLEEEVKKAGAEAARKARKGGR